jgi:hypothetical protein
MVSENEPDMTGESTEEQAPMGMESSGELQTPEPAPEAKTKAKRTGGRRAALRILREEVNSLGKEISGFRKSHEANSTKLEKQVAGLRSEVAALKSHIAKEGARARTKQEALLSKILAKVNAPKPKAKAPKKTKKSKGKK